MTEPIDIQVTDGVSPSIVPSLKEIAQNARESYSALATLQDALDSVNGSALNTLANAGKSTSETLKTTAQSQTTLTDATNKSSAATTNFTREAEKAKLATDHWGTSIGFLQSFLGALVGGLSIKWALDQAEAYDKMSDKLKEVSKNYEDYQRTQTRLFDIAQKTRQSLESTTSLYVGLSKAAQGTNISQTQLFRTTELIDKALTSSGKSADVAKNAIQAFAVGLNSGRTAGMAMRSLLIEFPALGKAVADGMRVNSVELIAMAQRGEVSFEKFSSAIIAAGAKIDEKFDRTKVSVSSAFTVLQNAIFQYVGQTNQASGVTDTLARAIIFLSGHVDVLAGIVALIAIRFGALLFINVASFFITIAEAAVKAGAAMLLGLLTPTGLVIAAFAVAGIAIAIYTGTLDALMAKAKDAGKALGDELNKRIEESVGQFKKGAEGAQKFGDATGTLTDRIKQADAEFKSTNDTMRENARLTEAARQKLFDYSMELLQSGINADKATEALQRQAVTVSNAASAYDRLTSSASAAAAAESSASSAFDASPGGGGSGVKGGAGGIGLYKEYEDAYQYYNQWKSAYGSLSGWMELMGYTGQIEAMEAMGNAAGAAALRKKAAMEFSKTDFAHTSADVALRRIQSRQGLGGGVGLPGGLGPGQDKFGRYAMGGEFLVGGQGGTDSRLVQFWASPEETVTVKTPAQKREEERNTKGVSRAMIHMPIQIIAKDIDSFRRNKTQVSAEMIALIRKASRRLGAG